MFNKVEKIASSLFLCAHESSVGPFATFHMFMDVDLDGHTKPLMIVGRTHPRLGNGYCIAVLNPCKSLLSQIDPGFAYDDRILTKIVKGKCDLALSLWINPELGFYPSRETQYENHKSSPARFSLLEIQMAGTLNRP